MKSNYILGGGVAGLILGYYSGSKIITDKIGGWQNLNKFKLGPRLLEVTENTKSFIRKIGLDDNKLRTVKIGYYDNGFIDILTKEFREKYAFKTRELTPDQIHESVLSSGKKELLVFDIDYDLILKILEEKLKENFIVEKIASIDLKEKKIYTQSSNTYEYSYIVNTLPQTLFQKLASVKTNHDFSGFHTTFFKCQYDDFFYDIKSKGYEYFYSVDVNHKWHRCSLFEEYFTLEVKGKVDELENVTVLDKTTIPWAQLKYSYKDLEFTHGIENIGRFAEWNHSIKMEELIERFEQV